MKSLFQFWGISVGLAMAVPAGATCTQANLAGTWTATSLSRTAAGDLAWTTCDLVINAQGRFVAATSKCNGSQGDASPAQGSLALAKPASCAYAGSITLTKYRQTNRIRLATLSLDHQVVSGVGGGLGAGGTFTFNMVKTK